jgi:hypothetical protein
MVGLEDRRDLTALALQRFAAGDLHHESTVF